ncbi:hypothetical protein WJX74_004047 [Apatococcus lobatus]|uniref:Uncharacterized protein n=1 Tax=Apatococcus lobatus TaxID=904363 RepID=A0AAW1RKL4_9CHLO
MTTSLNAVTYLLKPLLSFLSVAGAVALFLAFLALLWVATYHTGLQQLPIVRELLGKAKKDPRKQEEATKKLQRLQDLHSGRGLARARSTSGRLRTSKDAARLQSRP